MMTTCDELSSADDVLAVENLRVVYRAATWVARRREHLSALDGVSLWIARGERVAVVGASGSGKTTLARAICRLQRPTSGTVTLNAYTDRPGVDVWSAAGRQVAGRIQMVFQDPYGSLDPRRTVVEAVMDGRRGSRRSRRGWNDQVASMLAEVDLPTDAAFVARRPHQLSGGQRQRVALARALFGQPDLLVADEPTSMLDAPLRSALIALLRARSAARALTTVLITHDLSVARQFADRIVVVHQGRVCEQGPTGQLLARPQHPQTARLVAAQPRWPAH